MFLAKERFARGDLHERKRQRIVEASKKFCVRRECGFSATVEFGDIGETDLLLLLDVPTLYAEVRAEEDDLFAIRRKLRGLGINGVNAEDKLQRFSRKQ